MIIQGRKDTASSIYFRHCAGEFRNAKMQILDMQHEDGAMKSVPNKGCSYASPHQIAGLEWNGPRVQNIMIVDGITHL